MSRSVKTDRLLARLGVEEELDDGQPLVTVDPTYVLSDGRLARLAFERDEEAQLCVGYAIGTEDNWVMEEAERFSIRTLGYYQRRLKRIGERERPPEEDEWSREEEPDS